MFDRVRPRWLAVAVIAFGLLQATAALAQTIPVRYADAATGISFDGPLGLEVSPASAGVNGRTTQAIFSTFRGATDPRVRPAMQNELVITAYIANRMPNEDLRTFVVRNGLTGGRVTDLPRLRGILVTGNFQAGSRAYALIPRGQDTVLIFDAFPAFSSRFGLFNAALQSLEVR